jgi:hypothetical protein
VTDGNATTIERPRFIITAALTAIATAVLALFCIEASSTTRTPVVVINGRLQQLAPGDNINAACANFTSGAAGCVPASGGGTTNYLRADGMWAAAGGGGLSGLTTNTVPKATSSTTIGNGDITDNGTTIDLSDGNGYCAVTASTGNVAIKNGTGPLLTLNGSAGADQQLLTLTGADDNGNPNIASGAAFVWVVNVDNDRRLGLIDSAHTTSNSNNTLTLTTGNAGGGAGLQCYDTGVAGIGGGCQLSLNTLAGGIVAVGGTFDAEMLADFGGHLETLGPAQSGTTNLASCGTSPTGFSTGSTDLSGTVTEGTSATGCAITFKGTYTVSPFCVCGAANSAALAVSCSATATVLTIANTSATNPAVTYNCIGRSGGT